MALAAQRIDSNQPGPGDMQKYRFDSLSQWIGRELGVSDWTLISQEQINLFADCTGDRQWMHVDEARCRRESPYGATAS